MARWITHLYGTRPAAAGGGHEVQRRCLQRGGNSGGDTAREAYRWGTGRRAERGERPGWLGASAGVGGALDALRGAAVAEEAHPAVLDARVQRGGHLHRHLQLLDRDGRAKCAGVVGLVRVRLHADLEAPCRVDVGHHGGDVVQEGAAAAVLPLRVGLERPDKVHHGAVVAVDELPAPALYVLVHPARHGERVIRGGGGHGAAVVCRVVDHSPAQQCGSAPSSP
mmetsp:Transcript_512/g.1192  ORF Transcript_512/g.1192 Transcript_512/m.1192 type:complete len:224 (-) Transcript_512:700-1371(-)